ncbi:hypothetical protein [Rhodopirellula europaea]|uniref:hypothetical protein n=1 Tax=Rhodopirellula europaea TaxID=1263866 RepID=UPI0030EE77EC|tara:strand:- start:33 stop:503 length:471 start_codon:yes stop_codon:yes gene_type:complete
MKDRNKNKQTEKEMYIEREPGIVVSKDFVDFPSHELPANDDTPALVLENADTWLRGNDQDPWLQVGMVIVSWSVVQSYTHDEILTGLKSHANSQEFFSGNLIAWNDAHMEKRAAIYTVFDGQPENLIAFETYLAEQVTEVKRFRGHPFEQSTCFQH